MASPDLDRIRSNVATMIDKGASESEIDQYIAGEGVTLQDLHGARMSPEDEAGYEALAKDPDSTADELVAYAASKGFTLDPETAATFIDQRSAAGGKVGDGVTYTDDLPAPSQESQGDPQAQPEYGDASLADVVSGNLPDAPPKGENTLRENLRAGAGRFVDGIFPGAASTTRGLRGVIDNTYDAVVNGGEWHPGQSFNEYADDQKKVTARFSAGHPDIGDGLGWAGFGTSFALPGVNVMRGERLAAGTVNGLATGATYGTLGGLLNDSGDGRIANAENGLLFGGLLGGATPTVFRGGSAAGAFARRNVPGVDRAITMAGNGVNRARGLPQAPPNLAARAQAERLVAQEMDNGHISQGMGVNGPQSTPANVEAEVARRQALGVPAMPADTTQNLRRMTDWALQGRGPMTSRAREVLRARQAGAGGRVRQHVQDELGNAVDPIAEARAITERASADAGPAYEAAYAAQSPMTIDPDLGAIMQRPAFQRAMPQAYENIQNRGGNPQALGFRQLENGETMLSPQPSFEAFDQVLRTMNKSIPRDALGRPVLDNVSGGIQDAAGALDSHLKEMNPTYRDVKAQYADEMGIKTAMDRGGDVVKATGPEINDQLGRFTQPHAREAWTAGARTALADTATDRSLAPTANVPQAVRKAMGLSGAGLNAAGGDAAKLQAIETMSNRPGVVQRLDDRLEGEDQAFKTFSETFGNSKTYGRKAYDESVSGDGAAIAAKALSGRVVGATMDLLFRGRGASRFKQDVQERVAEVLTASQPADINEAMAAITRRAQTDRAFNASLHRAGINLSKVTALQAAGLPTLPDRAPLEPSGLPPAPALPVYGLDPN